MGTKRTKRTKRTKPTGRTAAGTVEDRLNAKLDALAQAVGTLAGGPRTSVVTLLQHDHGSDDGPFCMVFSTLDAAYWKAAALLVDGQALMLDSDADDRAIARQINAGAYREAVDAYNASREPDARFYIEENTVDYFVEPDSAAPRLAVDDDADAAPAGGAQ